MSSYAKYISRKSTPQNRRIPGRTDMVRNNAGGFVFRAGDAEYLRRILILGTMGGSYYVSEQKLTADAMSFLEKMLRRADTGIGTLQIARDINVRGATPFQEPAFVALAIGLASPDAEVRRYAGRVFHDMVRIPTHLYTIMRYVKEMRGSGALLRKTLEAWLHGRTPEQLAYHAIKYAGRTVEGKRWDLRDVLRIAHPKPMNTAYDAVFAYITQGKVRENAPKIIHLYEKMKRAGEREAVELIKQHRLTWEFVPGNLLGSAKVWRALLPNLPITALLRNLGRLTALGVIKPFSAEEESVAERISGMTTENIRKARLHPLNILKTLYIYAAGRGGLGNLTWEPSNAIVAALDELFERSYGAVDVTGKNTLIAVDVSGSMYWGASVRIGPKSLKIYEAAALLALVMLKSEKSSRVIFVDTKVHHSRGFNAKTSIANAIGIVSGYGHGGTDLALPFQYALDRGIGNIDVFVVFTDNETWAGKQHPVQAFEEYQRKHNPNAVAISVAMELNRHSIADPKNDRMFNLIGFDVNVMDHIKAIVNASFGLSDKE